MENELRLNLLRCADEFILRKGMSLATVGRLAAGDWRFFDRLREGEKTFTARKYDEVIGWLAANWPDAATWPSDVPRPTLVEVAA
jgi:hypothetical protein